jgi:hypothetical protein
MGCSIRWRAHSDNEHHWKQRLAVEGIGSDSYRHIPYRIFHLPAGSVQRRIEFLDLAYWRKQAGAVLRQRLKQTALGRYFNVVSRASLFSQLLNRSPCGEQLQFRAA